MPDLRQRARSLQVRLFPPPKPRPVVRLTRGPRVMDPGYVAREITDGT